MRILLVFCFGIMVDILCLPSLHISCCPVNNDSLSNNNVRAKAMELNNRAILKKTNSFFQKDSLRDALILLEEAIRIDTSYKLAFINLAQTQTETGKVGEAVMTLKKTLRGNYNDRSLLFSIGNNYNLLEETDSAQIYYDASLNAFKQCISIYPDSILLLANQHFVASIVKNDTTIITDFIKEYRHKYPNLKYLWFSDYKCTKKEFLKPMVLLEYREILQKEIENRCRAKK